MMDLRYLGMLNAIAQGVQRGKPDMRTGRELDRLFRDHERRGYPITLAHSEAVERRLLPPLRQGVTPE